MISALLGLVSALGFGTSDFLGGLAARYLGSLRTVLITGITSLIALLLGSLWLTGNWSLESWLFGGLSGLAGVIALVCLYASLAIGPMSILSPIGAVVGALVPTVWDIFAGDALGWFSYLAIALALSAVVMVSLAPGEHGVKPSIKGITLATAAGLLFGIYYILLDLAPDDAALGPAVANRAVAVVVIAIAVAAASVTRRMRRANSANRTPVQSSDIAAGEEGSLDWRRGLGLALITGVIEAVGTSLYLFGVVTGSLTVVSVLVSLYPAMTIVLATLVLKERLGVVQYVGLAVALIAASALALA